MLVHGQFRMVARIVREDYLRSKIGSQQLQSTGNNITMDYGHEATEHTNNEEILWTRAEAFRRQSCMIGSNNVHFTNLALLLFRDIIVYLPRTM